MQAILGTIKNALKNNMKIDQEGLDLFKATLNLRKDPERSRLVLTGTATSEVGIDLPGDTFEDMLAQGFEAATGDGTLGN